MKTWKEFISEITEEQFRQIIQDYKIFEKDGFIGICLLRTLAEQWVRNTGNSVGVILVMETIAKEAFRHFAELYLDDGK